MPVSRFWFALAAFIFSLPALSAAQAEAPAAMTAPAVIPPQIADTSASAPVTHGELPALVKEIIINNPEVLMQAAQTMRDRQMAEAQKTMSETLTTRKDEIFNDPDTPIVGDKNGDITIVEFFDYHCGYCHQLVPTIAKLLAEDKKLRVAFKEFPILSEDSVTASRAALGVYRIAPEKYFDFHQALMKGKGRFDEKTLLDAAKKLGIDSAKLKAEMDRPEVSTALEKNRSVAEGLGVRGTPAMVIGNELVPGALPYEELKKLVDRARAEAIVPAAAPAAAPATPAATAN